MKIQELAKLAGVSPATVSRVFGHHPNVRGEVRERVLAAARRHGYLPRLSGKRKNIVLLVPYRQSYPAPEYVEMVTTELIAALARKKFRIEIMPHGDLDRLNGNSFCGAVSIGVDAPEQWDERFALPLVTIDRPRGRSGCCYAVRSDEAQGMMLAIEHLAARGCAKIGVLIHGARSIGNVEERRSGALAALERCGVPHGAHLVRVADPDSFLEETGKLLRHGIDGLFCCGGGNAGGLAAYCLSLYDRHIPEDIKLVSSERVRISRYCIPPQTTISQEYVQLAERTVAVLEAALEGAAPPAETILPYHLIERDST